jgi:murein DD-endopeptidase MepM/ murein hydrolase activator NlpD
MIIPSKSGSSRAIKISKLLIPLFSVVLIFLIIIIGNTVWKYNKLKESQSKSVDNINFLNNKLSSQQKQIDNYKKLETEMKSTLEELKDLESQLKTKYGINTTSKSTSQNSIKQTSSQPINLSEAKKNITSLYSTMKLVDKKVSTQNVYPSFLPYYGKISSYYGTRRNPLSRGRYEFHTGLDICGPYGSKIKAAAAGVVVYSGWLAHYGYAIIIDHGNGYTTLYGHNCKLLVKKGKRVSKGQTISLLGSTGRSTGPHVHFEVRYLGKTVNPLKIIKGGKR